MLNWPSRKNDCHGNSIESISLYLTWQKFEHHSLLFWRVFEISKRYFFYYIGTLKEYMETFMSACTLFNEQDKGSNLLSIIAWSVLGKQNLHVYSSKQLLYVRVTMSEISKKRKRILFCHSSVSFSLCAVCLLKRDKTLRCAIYTIRMTYIYQVVVHVHQDCYTYIKIRHINIEAHIYMLNDATLTSRLSDIIIYVKILQQYVHQVSR